MTLVLVDGYMCDEDRKRLEEPVRAAMRRAIEESPGLFRDPAGITNTTKLAEYAACELDLYGPAPHYWIPEDLFELAFEVSPPDEADR